MTNDIPRITSFKFSASLNSELERDAVAEISDGYIVIEVQYTGTSAPAALIPEFSAEGTVKVWGSAQVSGISAQDFSRQLTYTVSNPSNPQLSRDYRVQVRLSSEAAAIITDFSFYKQENPGLADDIIAKIDQSNGKITAYARPGSGVTARTMIPRFTTTGNVSVGGMPQVSGVTGRVFNAPVTYTVVSLNGKNTKTYIVEVRELQTPIYVNCNARGMNDGMSWQDAFISLKAACEAAAEFPEDVPKEIWIAKGTYKPGAGVNDYFPLTANTSYIGGFAGNESGKSQRNPAANTVTISGDLGGGVTVQRLFQRENTPDIGDLLFDNLLLRDAFEVLTCFGTAGRIELLNITVNSIIRNVNIPNVSSFFISGGKNEFVIKNSTFINSYGILINGSGSVEVSNTNFTNFTTPQGTIALNIKDTDNVIIDNVNIDGYEVGIFFIICNSVQISNTTIRNCTSNYEGLFTCNSVQISNSTQ